ncbi:modular serine protease [Harpegnathos saltator]|uniref:Limulus clotting factor C n=1 Tax=Harpegnathos saltator TaxID=610380 RepID=E2BCT3_HARSA|nr:modular serine protease [Harpegnathos saltator]EFN86497.1 Limulus clotting factor C [Harpegnathos saltator]
MNTRAALSIVLSLLILLPSSFAEANHSAEVECGKYTRYDRELIENGGKVISTVFPWHVLIYLKKRDMTYIQICGGSLIRNNLVVSAAHCFYDEDSRHVKNASSFVVAAGKRYRAWDADQQYSQKSLVESIEVKDRYLGLAGNFIMDIALLKLNTPFELNMLVHPICIDWERENLYERDPLQSQLSKMVSWSKIIKDESNQRRIIKDESNQTLHEIDMPYVTYMQCKAESPRDVHRFLTVDKFCAGRLNDSSTCNGDGGSGLYIKKGEVWYLRGIASVKFGAFDECNSYSGFTNINFFYDWIRKAYDSA